MTVDMENPQTYSKIKWLNALVIQIAAVYFFLPAGRFAFSFFGYSVTTGYDIYKIFPVIFITWGWWRLENWRKPLPSSPFFLPLIAYFIYSLFAAAVSFDTYLSISDSLELGSYLFFFFILLDIPWNRKYLAWVASVFVIGHLYLGGVAVMQYFSASRFGEIRVNGNFNFPTELGGYTLLSFALLFWINYMTDIRWQKIATGIAIGLAYFAAVATLSRGTYIALVVYFVVLLLTAAPDIRKKASVYLLVVMILIGLFNPQIFARLNTIFHDPPISDNPPSRPEIWSTMLDMEIPTLSYFGLGMNKVIVERLASRIPAGVLDNTIDQAYSAHNQYLALFLFTGLTGLFFYFWLLILAFAVMWKMPRSLRSFFIASVSAYMINGVFEYTLLLTNFFIVLITIFAVSHSYLSQVERKEC